MELAFAWKLVLLLGGAAPLQKSPSLLPACLFHLCRRGEGQTPDDAGIKSHVGSKVPTTAEVASGASGTCGILLETSHINSLTMASSLPMNVKNFQN